MRILIADDEPGTRLLLTAAVQRLGHTAMVAEDGATAWTLYLAESPDVLISDWEMPGIDGTELTTRIRAHAGTKYTYVMVLTGRADQSAARATMHAGADELILKPLDTADLERRLIAAERVVALHRRLADDARHDSLTDLGNRRRLDEELAVLIARTERYGHRFALCMFDIDHFKQLNDTAGHLAGDQALRNVADALRSALRSGDSLYRYGGEEFVVTLPGQSSDGAMLAAERLRSAVEAMALPHPAGGSVTISAGVAVAEPAGITATELLAAADVALYRAKEQGRNRVVNHDPRASSAQAGRPVRLLIADDDPLTREFLRAIADTSPALEMVGAACDSQEAIETALLTRPDVVLLDLNMPGGGGVSAATAIRNGLPSSRIVAYSVADGPDSQLAMARAGAVGYIVKGAPASEIVKAVTSAARW
jgi:diguanylate cyclase (GGDEF)-like protein